MKMLSRKDYSVVSICDLIGITRQGYYKRLKKTESDSNLYNTMEQIVRDNRQLKSRAGLRAIYHKEKLSTLLGLNRFEKQMSLRGYALKPYKSFIRTTDSRGYHHKYDNLIEGIEITGKNQIIAGDITYYQTGSELYFIFIFTDLYTLEIKGMLGSKNMQGINAERCLRQVIKYNKLSQYNWKLILHTDGGGQYRSDAFHLMLKKMKIIPSQSKSCFENGLAERVNGIVKNEYLVDYNIKSVRQLNLVLRKIQDQHNKVWPSAKLGWQTPFEYDQWVKTLPLTQKPVLKVKELTIQNKGFLKA